MNDPVIWEEPITIEFQVEASDCRAARLGPSLWALDMGVCMVTFDEMPPVETEPLEVGRARVILGNMWFDTDETAAARIANLMQGELL